MLQLPPDYTHRVVLHYGSACTDCHLHGSPRFTGSALVTCVCHRTLHLLHGWLHYTGWLRLRLRVHYGYSLVRGSPRLSHTALHARLQFGYWLVLLRLPTCGCSRLLRGCGLVTHLTRLYTGYGYARLPDYRLHTTPFAVAPVIYGWLVVDLRFDWVPHVYHTVYISRCHGCYRSFCGSDCGWIAGYLRFLVTLRTLRIAHAHFAVTRLFCYGYATFTRLRLPCTVARLVWLPHVWLRLSCGYVRLLRCYACRSGYLVYLPVVHRTRTDTVTRFWFTVTDYVTFCTHVRSAGCHHTGFWIRCIYTVTRATFTAGSILGSGCYTTRWLVTRFTLPHTRCYTRGYVHICHTTRLVYVILPATVCYGCLRLPHAVTALRAVTVGLRLHAARLRGLHAVALRLPHAFYVSYGLRGSVYGYAHMHTFTHAHGYVYCRTLHTPRYHPTPRVVGYPVGSHHWLHYLYLCWLVTAFLVLPRFTHARWVRGCTLRLPHTRSHIWFTHVLVTVIHTVGLYTLVTVWLRTGYALRTHTHTYALYGLPRFGFRAHTFTPHTLPAVHCLTSSCGSAGSPPRTPLRFRLVGLVGFWFLCRITVTHCGLYTAAHVWIMVGWFYFVLVGYTGCARLRSRLVYRRTCVRGYVGYAYVGSTHGCWFVPARTPHICWFTAVLPRFLCRLLPHTTHTVLPYTRFDFCSLHVYTRTFRFAHTFAFTFGFYLLPLLRLRVTRFTGLVTHARGCTRLPATRRHTLLRCYISCCVLGYL